MHLGLSATVYAKLRGLLCAVSFLFPPLHGLLGSNLGFWTCPPSTHGAVLRNKSSFSVYSSDQFCSSRESDGKLLWEFRCVKNFMGRHTVQYQEGVRVRVGKQLGTLKFPSCFLLLHSFSASWDTCFPFTKQNMLIPNSLTERQQGTLHAALCEQESEVPNSLQRKMQKFLSKVRRLNAVVCSKNSVLEKQ